jgi:glycosyltransferase involved in cell wall biosynthesis
MTTLAQPSARRRILMTVDAVGGVWRYAMDLALGLQPLGVHTVFACFGPEPSAAQREEAQTVGTLVCCDAPLDWMVEDAAALTRVPEIIADLSRRQAVDLVHLNLPSQAASLAVDLPVVVVAHSCVCTWFEAVRGHAVPKPWAWQVDFNRQGFGRADAVIMPSRSHADLSRQVYGQIDRLHVVYNATRMSPSRGPKQDMVFAAGRWWDDGKNGAVLDAAAPALSWPVMMAGDNRGPNGQYVPLHNVSHLGPLSYSETMRLMTRAGMVVSPSVYEPFGLAALEAARCASALVLADIPTYRELWEGAAVFADPHDCEAFAAAINQLAKHPALRRALGRQAQARSQGFTLEAQAESIGMIYQRLLSA